MRRPLRGVVGLRVPPHTAQHRPPLHAGDSTLLPCLHSVPGQKAGTRIPPVRCRSLSEVQLGCNLPRGLGQVRTPGLSSALTLLKRNSKEGRTQRKNAIVPSHLLFCHNVVWLRSWLGNKQQGRSLAG